MNEAIKEELGKYWDKIPEGLSHKQVEFLLKASHAIDFHKQKGTEPEPYLSSVDMLLDMHKNIATAGKISNETLNQAIAGDMDALLKAQMLMELPYYQNAQIFEYNNDLPQNPSAGDVAEFKASISAEQLDNMLSAAFEITSIRRANPTMGFEDAHDCFSAMQDRALNHFGKMIGLKLKPDENASVEENKNRQALREMVMRKPRETLVLTDGCEDTKIFGLGDLKAKLEKVEERANAVDPLNLDKSIDALQSHKESGFARRMGIGKDIHNEQQNSTNGKVSNDR